MGEDLRIIPARGDIAALHLKDVVEAQTYVSGEEMRVAVPAAPMTGAPDGSPSHSVTNHSMSLATMCDVLFHTSPSFSRFLR